MQIIMENYAHFLEQNNGQGSIIIESRNQKDDVKLQEHFNALKKHGTLFLSRHSLQKNIGTISFYMKSANIIGLQIADFIPNAMKKHITNQKQSKPSIATEIYNKAYDGAYDDKNRFGIKKIL